MRKRIAKARRAAGVTHREVAEATYKSLRTSMRWCSGDLSPDLRVLIVLSRLFGCKVSDLTGVP